MSDSGWQVTPAALTEDLEVVLEAADRSAWKLSDHLDDRTKAQLLELAKSVR